MVDTSWDRPGVDPESIFDALEEQIASNEQSPSKDQGRKSSGSRQGKLAVVMYALTLRPALVGRVKWLIACFDRVLLDDPPMLPVIWRQSDNGMAEFPSPSRAASPSLAQGGQLTSVRGAESGGEARSPHAEKQPPDARPEPMQNKMSSQSTTWQNIITSSSSASRNQQVETSGGEQPVHMPSGEKQPAVEMPSGEKQPAVEMPSGEKQPAVEMPSGEKQPAVEMPSGEKQPAVEMPSGEKQPAVEMPSGEKQPVQMLSGEKQPAVKVLSGEKQPAERDANTDISWSG